MSKFRDLARQAYLNRILDNSLWWLKDTANTREAFQRLSPTAPYAVSGNTVWADDQLALFYLGDDRWAVIGYCSYCKGKITSKPCADLADVGEQLVRFDANHNCTDIA